MVFSSVITLTTFSFLKSIYQTLHRYDRNKLNLNLSLTGSMLSRSLHLTEPVYKRKMFFHAAAFECSGAQGA